MNLVVVGFGFQVVDRLLPVGSENITIVTVQALIDLQIPHQFVIHRVRAGAYICPCSLI